MKKKVIVGSVLFVVVLAFVPLLYVQGVLGVDPAGNEEVLPAFSIPGVEHSEEYLLVDYYPFEYLSMAESVRVYYEVRDGNEILTHGEDEISAAGGLKQRFVLSIDKEHLPESFDIVLRFFEDEVLLGEQIVSSSDLVS